MIYRFWISSRRSPVGGTPPRVNHIFTMVVGVPSSGRAPHALGRTIFGAWSKAYTAHPAQRRGDGGAELKGFRREPWRRSLVRSGQRQVGGGVGYGHRGQSGVGGLRHCGGCTGAGAPGASRGRSGAGGVLGIPRWQGGAGRETGSRVVPLIS